MYVFGFYVNVLDLLLVFNALLVIIVLFEVSQVLSLRRLVDDLKRVDIDLRKVDQDLTKKKN